MTRTAVLTLVLLAGCQDPIVERERRCNEIEEAGGDPLDLVDTGEWRVGPFPLWTTPARLRSELGEPDGFVPMPPPEIEWRVPIYEYGDKWATYVEVGDTLAYASEIFLADAPLVTGSRRFESGASLTSIRREFPQSWECHDWPFYSAEWRAEYETEVIVEDPVRDARVGLRFRDGRLGRVGVNWHRASREFQQRAVRDSIEADTARRRS